MRLKLANCLPQRQIVYYRLEYNFFGEPDLGNKHRQPKSIPVEAGKQVVIGGDPHEQQVKAIITQLELYGAIQVENMGRLPKTVVPYLLSIDKDVPAKMVLDVHKHNKGILTAQGQTRRETAAVVANDIVEKTMQANLGAFEVEIEQQDPEPGEADPVGSRLTEGLRIDKKATSNKRGGKSRPSA